MSWSSDDYWLKAKRYSQRGHDAPPQDPDFPFFCALALEFLCRSALAHVHPALLADGKDDGVSILFACGVTAKGHPKTIDMKAVIHRLGIVIPEYAAQHARICTTLIQLRNEELHSGALPFEGKKESSWLPQFYGACNCLCRSMKRTLDDLVGRDVAANASALMKAAHDEKKGLVHQRIASHREVFGSKPEPERAALLKASLGFQFPDPDDVRAGRGRITDDCPACGGKAWRLGVPVSETEPMLVDGMLEVSTTYLSHSFRCRVCGLHLDSAEEVAIAGFEPRFTRVEQSHPSDAAGEEEEPYMDM